MVAAQRKHFDQCYFVDRKNCIQNFKKAVNNIGQKKFSVLVYYGVAGIGKTSLRKKFINCLEKYNLKNQKQDVTWVSTQQQEVIWTSIDLQLDAHREKSTFLVTLKNDLQKRHKIDFPAFEIAHAIYWKKAKPEIPLRKDNYLLFDGDNAFDDFFEVGNQIPYFSIVPASLRLLKNLPDHLRKLLAKKGETELKQLSEKEPLEIEEMLPYFWTLDLNNYLGGLSKTAVLFIDTYEVLRENYTDGVCSLDKWIREELIPCLPNNVLWVIFGREALKWEEMGSEWEECLTQYEVGELLRKYCFEYLESRGIIDKEIQEAIFTGSKGVPYYLELSADTYVKIVENEKPKTENFGNNHQEIAGRFFRFLSREEKDSLNVLSIPRFWDFDLFKYLVKEFNTGYPTYKYEDFCSFSFIGKVESNKQKMHQLMQDCLQKTQVKKRPDSVKRIHKAINEYYTNKLDNIDIRAISREHEIALIEAFYHAKNSMETEDLFIWFIIVSEPFNKAAFWQLIAPLYDEMLQILEAETKLGPEHPYVIETLNILARLYRQMGNYGRALPLFQRVLDIREKVLGSQHPDVAKTLNDLAGLYRQMGDYEKALPLFQRALRIHENVLGPQHPEVALALNDFAVLYYKLGDYKKALPLSQRALDINEKVLGLQHQEVAINLNNLGRLSYMNGDYEKALIFYQRALEIREKVLNPQHPEIAITLNNLAALYRQMGDYEKSLLLFQRALDIHEKVLSSEHPDVAIILNNFAGLYTQIGDYEKSLPLYQRALDIREKVLGIQHPDVATTLSYFAELYTQMGDYEKAFLLLQRALRIHEKVSGPQHPEIAITLNNLGRLFYMTGDYEKSLPLYQRALDIREKVLGMQHPDVATTLSNLAGLYDSMGDNEKALPLYQRALDIREKALGPNHPDTVIVRNNIRKL